MANSPQVFRQSIPWKVKVFLLKRYKRLLTTSPPHFSTFILRSLLALGSYLYRLIFQGWFFLYRAGIFKSKKLPCKVISVGNITVGGTGKTPAVETIARMCAAAGRSPVILSRGYGRQQKSICIGSAKTSFREVGDEPILLARKLRGIPVVVGQDRFEAGLEALQTFRPQVLILDDGFQHLRLERDLDLVLIDATDPFGQGHLLPRGFLREPLENLSRADLFLITRSDEGKPLEEIRQTLRALNPEAPIWVSGHLFYTVRKFQDSLEISPSSLSNKKILAFAGIGNPQSFLSSLRKAGLSPIHFLEFPDHYPYSREELKRIEDLALKLQVEYILTTEKDEVRMEGFKPRTDKFYTGVIRLEIFQAEEFQRFLLSKV